MPDISTVWDPADGRGDWTLAQADLLAGDDLATSVLISLFSDRRADPDDAVPDGSGNRRGWWGDAGRDRPLGSKLWLLERAKRTEEVRLRALDYVEDALQWLVDDGIVASLQVETEWQEGGRLGCRVVLFEPDGSVLRDFNYAWAWKDVS